MTARHSAETAVSQQGQMHLKQADGSGALDEKKVAAGLPSKDLKDGGAGNIQISTLDKDAIYDPRQESIWTQLGLSFESFKRAPGTTAGHVGEDDVSPQDGGGKGTKDFRQSLAPPTWRHP